MFYNENDQPILSLRSPRMIHFVYKHSIIKHMELSSGVTHYITIKLIRIHKKVVRIMMVSRKKIHVRPF
jgi:hypothetical protein